MSYNQTAQHIPTILNTVSIFDIQNLEFVKGKHYENHANVYEFTSDRYKVFISEKAGEFLAVQNGDLSNKTINTSEYRACEIFLKDSNKQVTSTLIWRDDEEFKKVRAIKSVIDNYDGNTVSFCYGCNTIVESNNYYPNSKNCVHCQMYTCKVCKRKHPKYELENGLCEKCR